MGRLLEPASFGEVQALISLFLQATIFLSVLGLVTITVVANYQTNATRNAVVLEFERLAFLVSLVFLLLVVAFQHQLKLFLQFDSSWPLVLLAFALVASVPFTFRGAFLRGRQQFGLASMVNVLGAGGKLLLSAILVVAGWQTAGAVGGLIVAQVLASIAALWWAKRYGLQRAAKDRLWRLPSLKLLKPELRYGFLVLVGSLIVTLQYSLDVVVVKHYFDPHTAGLYAGIAGVARIIFFLTASCALVMMPMVKVDAPRTANTRLLAKSCLLVAAVGLPVLILFVVAPGQISALLMGGEYRTFANVLPLLGATIFIISFINIIILYFLALRQYRVAPIMGLGAVVTYVLLYLRHNSIEAVVSSLFIGSCVMLIALALWGTYPRLKEVVAT